jgi:hypothetical protein
VLAAALFAIIWSVFAIRALETRVGTAEALLKQRLMEEAVAACNKEAEARGETMRFNVSWLPHARLSLIREPSGSATAAIEIDTDGLACEYGFAWPPKLRRDPDSPELETRKPGQ